MLTLNARGGGVTGIPYVLTWCPCLLHFLQEGIPVWFHPRQENLHVVPEPDRREFGNAEKGETGCLFQVFFTIVAITPCIVAITSVPLDEAYRIQLLKIEIRQCTMNTLCDDYYVSSRKGHKPGLEPLCAARANNGRIILASLQHHRCHKIITYR